MPRAVQRATAADVPYSISSGCATTQSTRWKDSSGRAGNVMPAILPELFPVGMDRPARVQLAPARADLRPVAADDPGHIGHGLGRQRQCGTVEKHQGPRADESDCGDRFIYQGYETARRP